MKRKINPNIISTQSTGQMMPGYRPLSGLILLVATISFVLSGCGGAGDSESGANADPTTSDIAGVYEGSETLKLVETDTQEAIDNVENEVTITITNDGTLRLSTTSGSSGNARIRQDRTFTMTSDARTQFGGLCETGTIYLEGRIANEKVTAKYRSEELSCAGNQHKLTGSLHASRGAPSPSE